MAVLYMNSLDESIDRTVNSQSSNIFTLNNILDVVAQIYVAKYQDFKIRN